jgi:hypothetical protein
MPSCKTREELEVIHLFFGDVYIDDIITDRRLVEKEMGEIREYMRGKVASLQEGASNQESFLREIQSEVEYQLEKMGFRVFDYENVRFGI